MVSFRPSLFRSLLSRSHRFAAATTTTHNLVSLSDNNTHFSLRTLFTLSSSSHLSLYPNNRISQEFGSPLSVGLGSLRFYSAEVTHMPDIKDPQLLNAFKDLMAVNWSELPDAVIQDVKEVLSKSTDDKAGKEVVENVFQAAEAVEEFSGMLSNLKMELDDSVGMSGEDVKPLPDSIKKALIIIFDRYSTYLNSFGPDESYLRKKVETELGTKMIHLKMRCSGLDAGWGKVTVLGTSGLAGSYVEQRA